jgi:hypothetical protein
MVDRRKGHHARDRGGRDEDAPDDDPSATHRRRAVSAHPTTVPTGAKGR